MFQSVEFPTENELSARGLFLSVAVPLRNSAAVRLYCSMNPENGGFPKNQEINQTQTSQVLEISSQPVNASKVTTPKPYSEVIAERPLSRRENTIIIVSMEGLTIDDYLDGIEQLMDLTKVRYIFKISGSRVCVYLIDQKYSLPKTK